MKKEVVTTGRTIEDAVAAAVSALNASSEKEIKYTVLEEPKKGLFGLGAVPAKINAVYVPSPENLAIAFIKQFHL